MAVPHLSQQQNGPLMTLSCLWSLAAGQDDGHMPGGCRVPFLTAPAFALPAADRPSAAESGPRSASGSTDHAQPPQPPYPSPALWNCVRARRSSRPHRAGLGSACGSDESGPIGCGSMTGSSAKLSSSIIAHPQSTGPPADRGRRVRPSGKACEVDPVVLARRSVVTQCRATQLSTRADVECRKGVLVPRVPLYPPADRAVRTPPATASPPTSTSISTHSTSISPLPRQFKEARRKTWFEW